MALPLLPLTVIVLGPVVTLLVFTFIENEAVAVVDPLDGESETETGQLGVIPDPFGALQFIDTRPLNPVVVDTATV